MRLIGLDYLRGICAIGIMFFHYHTILLGKVNAQSVLGKFEIYGVSTIYIISGIILFQIYGARLIDFAFLKTFFKKRFLRIFPLYWIALFLTIIIIHRSFPNPTDLLLNITGLFSILSWDNELVLGGWSIGNELVFYLLLPPIILISNFKKSYYLLGVVLLFIYIWFAFYSLNHSQSLNLQWHIYSNPLNQVCLFYVGTLISMHFMNRKISNIWLYFCLFVAICFFIIYPTTTSSISLVTGFYRVFATFSILLISLYFYKLNNMKNIELLTKIGKSSYSIYLLHPIILTLIASTFKRIVQSNTDSYKYEIFGISVIATLIVSVFVYNYFESFFNNLSKK